MKKDILECKEETLIIDCCTCGKSRQSVTIKEFHSDVTDTNLKGTMRDFGFAWIKILNNHILEIDSINDTSSYKRSPGGIINEIPLTKKQIKERLTRLEALALQHPGLYKVAISQTEDSIEPIEVVLKRLNIRRKEKRIRGEEIDRADKQDDIRRIDQRIKELNKELNQLKAST